MVKMKTTDKLKTLGGDEGHDIEKDFSKLYEAQEPYNSQNSGYPNENNQAEWDTCPFKIQSQILIKKLVEISGNQKFKELGEYLTEWTSPGATRNTNDAIKELTEHIYFQLLDAKNKGIDVEKTFSGLINNSIFACNEGGYTNLQNLSMAIDGGSKLIYNAKYEFISNATTEFRRKYIIGYHGSEVHDVNQFIASIKQEYKLSPPPDIHANATLIDQVIDSGQYRKYIDSLFSSKIAANAILDKIVNKIALQLQDEVSIKRKFDMLSDDDRSQKNSITEALQNVFRPYVDPSVLELIEYQLLDISVQTEDEGYYLDVAGYKANYLEIIEIIMANFLGKTGYLEGVRFPFKDGNIIITENSVYSCPKTPNSDDNNCYIKEIDLRKLSELSFGDKKLVDVIRDLLIKEEQLYKNMNIVAIRTSIASLLIEEIKQAMPDAKIPDKLLSIAEADLTKYLALLSDRVIKFYTVQDIKFSEQDFEELSQLYDNNLEKFQALTSSDEVLNAYRLGGATFKELSQVYDTDKQKFQALTSAEEVYKAGATFQELSQLYDDTDKQKFDALTSSDEVLDAYRSGGATFQELSQLYDDTDKQKFRALTHNVAIIYTDGGATFKELKKII